MKNSPLRKMPFSKAADRWIQMHSAYISPVTAKDYKKCIKKLKDHFGKKTLSRITIEDVRRFQTSRRAKAKAQMINKECSCLQQIMKEADLWHDLSRYYRRLKPEPTTVGQPMSPEQESRLVNLVERSGKHWGLAGNCLLLMANTTCGFGEVRMLKRGDVDLEKRVIHVRDGAKNKFRVRTIPLNEIAFRAASWLVRRWERIGGTEPKQMLLPHRAHKVGADWDFSQAMGSIKGAWKKIRTEAGLPDKMRIYDMRVHAITKLLSSPSVSPQVAKEIAGHITQQMQDRYSHQLIQTKRAAVEVLDSTSAETTTTARPVLGQFSSTALIGTILKPK